MLMESKQLLIYIGIAGFLWNLSIMKEVIMID